MNSTINSGALELRGLYQKYIIESLLIAGVFHFMLIGGYRVYVDITKDVIEFPHGGHTDTLYVLPPPPPIGDRVTLPTPVLRMGERPSVGILVPIPNAEINPEATIATQSEMNETFIGSETGDPNGTVYVPQNTVIVDDSPPPVFRPVEKQPVPVSQPKPIYPEIPRRAGVEGTVWVNMWVTKEGKVRQAVVLKSTSELFNQAAIDAAVQWTFTPAIMNNGPVAVWVSVPFRFQLNAK